MGKKARTEKSKEASNLKLDPKYIDACKVVKGLEPKNGNFATKPAATEEAPAESKEAPAESAEAPAETKETKKKDDKPKKKQDAGISPDERKELESLKTDIIAKKTELKGEGMSGGQINKHEDVVRMVTRMNELKEKENPGCLAQQNEDKKKPKKGKTLSSDQEAAKAALEKEMEEYRGKLKSEFGYSAKDIKADPDMKEMEAKLAAYK